MYRGAGWHVAQCSHQCFTTLISPLSPFCKGCSDFIDLEKYEPGWGLEPVFGRCESPVLPMQPPAHTFLDHWNPYLTRRRRECRVRTHTTCLPDPDPSCMMSVVTAIMLTARSSVPGGWVACSPVLPSVLHNTDVTNYHHFVRDVPILLISKNTSLAGDTNLCSVGVNHPCYQCSRQLIPS